MTISYDKLWKLLIDKKMNRTDLKNAAGVSFNVLAKMSRNEFVSLESLCKICSALTCDIGDVMEFLKMNLLDFAIQTTNQYIDQIPKSQRKKYGQFFTSKETAIFILYIITNEKAGEWFTTTDVLCLMTDIFGEAATKDQVNGVFKREKLWFKAENVDGSNREVKRKLLNKGIEYAQSLVGGTEQSVSQQ